MTRDADPSLPRPGDVLDGKYRLDREIGRGGMGVVWEASHLRLAQRFAIKMLAPAMLEDAETIHRFEREARAAAHLKGQHVVRVIDVATTSAGVPYMVMELLEGTDLEAQIPDGRCVPLPAAVDYVLQACVALAEAHGAGIVHRDLKPGNLFLAAGDDGVKVKILDFGISKVMNDDAKLTAAHAAIGTPIYMSPEQLRSSAVVDGRSDIWSLGIILYEIVSGAPPFNGASMEVAAAIAADPVPPLLSRANVPPPFAAIVHRMLAKRPDERFATVQEVAAALLPFAPYGSVGRVGAEQLLRRSPPSSAQLPRAPLSAPISGSLPLAPSAPVQRPQPARTETVFATQPIPKRSSNVVLGAILAVGLLVLLGGGAALWMKKRSPIAHEPATTSASMGVPVIVDVPDAAPIAIKGEDPKPEPSSAASAAATTSVAAPSPVAAPKPTSTTPQVGKPKPTAPTSTTPAKPPPKPNENPVYL